MHFDKIGTLPLALTLAAYALAKTIGRGHFGRLNIALLLAAVIGAGLFGLSQARRASPLIRLSLVRNPALAASLAMSILVSTVMMSTLVVGPFYLTQSLGLTTALVGVVLSAGPLVAALTGVPAGRLVDRCGAQRITLAGLGAMASGALCLSMMPQSAGLAGYMGAIAVITAGHALFQAANNTAIMINVRPDQRGVVSGMLSMSRFLGLITGASAMGAVFAFSSGFVSAVKNHPTAGPTAVATGMRISFAVAAVLIGIAIGIAVSSLTLGAARSRPGDVS